MSPSKISLELASSPPPPPYTHCGENRHPSSPSTSPPRLHHAHNKTRTGKTSLLPSPVSKHDLTGAGFLSPPCTHCDQGGQSLTTPSPPRPHHSHTKTRTGRTSLLPSCCHQARTHRSWPSPLPPLPTPQTHQAHTVTRPGKTSPLPAPAVLPMHTRERERERERGGGGGRAAGRPRTLCNHPINESNRQQIVLLRPLRSPLGRHPPPRIDADPGGIFPYMKLNQPFTVCTRRSYLMLDSPREFRPVPRDSVTPRFPGLPSV